VLPPGLPQVFLPVRSEPPEGTGLSYVPALVGIARVQYVDARTRQLKHAEETALLLRLTGEDTRVDWQAAEETALCLEELEREPEGPARYGALPAAAAREKSYAAWERDLADTLVRTRCLELRQSPSLGLISEPGESEGDFRVRLADLARARRDRWRWCASASRPRGSRCRPRSRSGPRCSRPSSAASG
jgi:hypothetical protein